MLAMCFTLISDLPLAGAVKAISGFSGEGNEKKPYKITSAEELKRLSDIVNEEKNDREGYISG